MDAYQPHLLHAQLFQEGKAFVSCVIVRTQGSTPRKAGARMTVVSDGSIWGTIGGGSIEATVIDEARQMLGKADTLLRTFQLDQDELMICGGMMEVFLESVGVWPKLYIFGAGHVGKAVARLANEVGFKVTLMDEREHMISSLSMNNIILVHGDYSLLAWELPVDAQTYILITTHEHAKDEMILGILIKASPPYLGMIASKRKAARAKENLLLPGDITPEQIERVDMPVGIPIASQTPVEIAVSIVAKLIDVKNRS